MANPTFIVSYVAEADIAACRIVKPGAADIAVTPGAASTDALLGVCGPLAGETGYPVDITLAGSAEVEFGGNVTRGDWLTSDADGRAVSAAPASGVNANVIGRALVSGVAGDIGSCLLAPGRIQG